MAIFTVTNTNDSGAGSLRQAIEDANALSGKDEIVFEDSLSGGRIDLTSGRLEINDSVSIQGLGAEQLAISSNEITFLINDGTENVIEVEIDSLSLVENGSINFGRFGYYGAAIANRENLTVTNSVISDGDIGSDGIVVSGYDNQAELTLIDSTISGFVTGIDSKAENITVVGSSFFDNSYSGIESNVDLSGLGLGGRFPNTNNSIGTVDIVQSTISGNAGGIAINGDSVTAVNIDNTTISDNDGSGISYYSDSYYRDTPSSDFVITSSIVAGNRVNEFNSAETVDLAENGVFTSGGNNLIGVGNTSFIDGVNGDIVGTAENPIDPRLASLQDNGGNTPTQALLSDSPAIDAGSNPLNLETDQRGEGFARVRGSQTDIGAFEADADTNPPNGNEGELISGTNKRDSLEGGAGNDTIDGSLARDTINGAGGDDSLFGGRGKDLIFGDAGNDEIAGNQGGDTLEGGSGSDTLFGDEGRDVLVGGAGFDILVGGGSSDSFVIASGQDTDGIIDFEPRRDKLLLSEGLSFGGLTLNQNNEDVDIVLSETDELLAVLIDTNVNNLGKSNFVAG